jgi:hypothetical protein
MRTMYDSTNAKDIPIDAQMVAGYVDGRYRWSDADWARFPNAVKVRIACFSQTDDGQVLDIESGCSEPEDAPGWARRRRAVGVDPTVYVNRSNLKAVRFPFDQIGEPMPHIWLASYDGVAEIPEGMVAKQYANEPLAGGHFDLSVVADFWPGIDAPQGNDTPQLGGQSADLDLRVGDVGILQAGYRWSDGRERAVIRKVHAHSLRTRRTVITVYPPEDPDADETLCLDAEPAIFIVNVRPS